MWKCGMKHDWRFVVTHQPPVTWEYKYGASFMLPQCIRGSRGGGDENELQST